MLRCPGIIIQGIFMPGSLLPRFQTGLFGNAVRARFPGLAGLTRYHPDARKEDDRPDDRPFDATDAADDGDEDHERGPIVDAEGGVG